jgi:hypothetical protein
LLNFLGSISWSYSDAMPLRRLFVHGLQLSPRRSILPANQAFLHPEKIPPRYLNPLIIGLTIIFLDYIYLRHIPVLKVHLFTAIQIGGLAILWAIKSYKPISIIFPVMVVAIVGIRKVK